MSGRITIHHWLNLPGDDLDKIDIDNILIQKNENDCWVLTIKGKYKSQSADDTNLYVWAWGE